MTHLAIRILASSLLITSVASATEPSEAQVASNYELTALSTATGLTCDASHSFRTELRLCDAEGCTRLDVTALPSVNFTLEAGHTATLTSSVAYEVDGVVFGSSESHELETAGGTRFAQTVTGQGECMKSVYYQLALTGSGA